jgi:hypothetical protein
MPSTALREVHDEINTELHDKFASMRVHVRFTDRFPMGRAPRSIGRHSAALDRGDASFIRISCAAGEPAKTQRAAHTLMQNGVKL